MMLVRGRIGPSAIHGNGLFALDPIRRGSLIWQMDDLIDREFAQSRFDAMPSALQHFLRVFSYPHMFKPGVLVLNTDDSRFMNHSFSANTEFRSFYKGYALCDIAAGEEITCNYAEFDVRYRVLAKPTERSHGARPAWLASSA